MGKITAYRNPENTGSGVFLGYFIEATVESRNKRSVGWLSKFYKHVPHTPFLHEFVRIRRKGQPGQGWIPACQK
jgi:hypothetical protein